jgi:D-beta-D-heptose 7-phosphate kinase/D-beta-D-heptose 1-phosphate adenosyltransferase
VSLKVLVIGDIMIDHYIWGSSYRISPEAPIQIVDVEKESNTLGGAGNVVNNLKAFGCDVEIVSVLGDDEESKIIVDMLDKIDVKASIFFDSSRKSTKKSRIIASSQQVIRYDKETQSAIKVKFENRILKRVNDIIDSFNIVLISDYGKGVITKKVVSDIVKLSKKRDIKVLVDPKGVDFKKYKRAFLLTPNKKEASLATGIDIVNKKTLKKALLALRKIALVDTPLITLSEDGIAILDENSNLIIKPTVAKEVFDVTGAGDTVLASLGYYLSLGKSIEDSLEFANLAAGVVVGKIGSATATLDEIEEYKSTLHKSSIESHIKNFDEIKIVLDRLKSQKKRVVFTNGCFDILHKGHVKYLDKAKSFGDVLILGLNSDESVKRLKGKNRPINSEDDRAYILAALESVDYVVKFTQDTPYELIKIVEPDILVKGGDYKGKEVVGSDIAKELKLVDFVDGKSTTNTIEKIKITNSSC